MQAEEVTSENTEPKPSNKQTAALDREIQTEELVDALFTLQKDKAAGRDNILSKDMIELLDMSIASENWKNVEILRFIHKMMKNLWEKEKVPQSFEETVIRPFLKNAEKDPTNPSNYRPVSLLNVLMKVYEHIIKERLVTFLEQKNIFSIER